MSEDPQRLVSVFRQGAPYINAHRGATFVIAFGGEAFNGDALAPLIHDIALLNSLGVRIVLVPGARPQIERRLRERDLEMRYVHGRRVTDEAALECVREAVGEVRLELEARLSMGLANSPMAGLRVRAASGNFVMAHPFGVHEGVDYQHTGEVRRIDADAIGERLDDGAVVLVPPLGYSPTGEVFNLYSEDVALAVARALRAEKLLYLLEGRDVTDVRGGLVRQMTTDETRGYLGEHGEALPEEMTRLLRGAIDVCHGGVRRVHLLDRHRDGALLMELFTRDGVGTLITAQSFERTRRAGVDDVPGILALIEPMERAGVLVRRSRERLETEIGEFTVMEREGTVVACAALHPMPDAPMAELACVAVHPDYRGTGRGDRLLARLEAEARSRGLEAVFVLTTRTAHWFEERGFHRVAPEDLPGSRRSLYNLQRNSRVYLKTLGPA
ncbi:Amino-acid acetyltransferase [wastewater metagenome]|uniref:amino-acid N-acetyltransferase n=2 Tax=unclassified sequences TaxID=12908 RepID=A0A5B8RE61_9ZZZZ|nr:amino-acid N-acetyltransferase [Arhodomonas aquaeolei]MCS4502958.1 amino-acid N-acetyltransferase [Arhodomonas aquaeolei]QEA06188.1 amino-acid acetyltransferase [uncultured organism]